MSLYHPVDIGTLHLDGNLFLAPIAGYSDMAFRSLCVEYGASFCTTEMVSAEALVRGNKKTELLMRRAPNEKIYCVQIFGGNAQTMAEAAKIVLEKTDCNCIDINGGCPVPKITKTGAGSVLTKEPERLYSIVKAVKESSIEYASLHPERGNVPVTIKIRSGWDSSNITWKECADAALKAGADAITIHARTKAQGYSGKANWEIQKQLVDFVAKRIPVFGSGDAFSPETAKLMLEAGLRELKMNVSEHGERAACMLMRKKFCAYSSGIKGGAKLREQIVNSVSIKDYEELFQQFL